MINVSTDRTVAYLHEIISAMPNNVYWKDRNGVYQGSNENHLKILGVKSLDQLIGKTDYDLLPRHLADIVRKNDARVINNDKEETMEEIDDRYPNNPIIYLTTKKPLHDLNGTVIGILGISVDITERKNMERELAIAKEKAEAASRAKTDFIHNISHDLRTPFCGILGYAELLKGKLDDAENAKAAEHIFDSAEKVLQLLNEVLNIVSVDNELQHKVEKVTLKRIVEDVAKLLRVEAEHKNIELYVASDDNINPSQQIVTDSFKLYHILISLISNAVKFTHEGRVDVETYIYKMNGEGRLRITVSDTGVGIPEEKHSEIFEKFVRLTNSYNSNYKGLGIGLYTVKRYVADLGGSITVKSKPNEGATFVCSIPIKIADDQEDALGGE